jgi:protein O-GlcNAc transferase
MNTERFAAGLPTLYEGWGGPLIRPRSARRFDDVLHRVRGMTSANVLQLLNWAVACLEGDEAYGEVGCFQGATLIGAMLDHSDRTAYAADNFSEFDPDGLNHSRLRNNLDAFGLRDQVRFHNQDCEEFLLGLRASRVTFGVYLYDGAHDYRSQLMGLLLAVSLLPERAVLVVDDGNVSAVKQATWDFLSARPEARLLLDLPTPGNCDPTFWNGVQVISWDANARNGCDWVSQRRARQSALLESLYALQLVNLKAEGGTVRMTRLEYP